MALQSKTITGSTSSNYWSFKLVATENSTSINNNSSSLTTTAYIGRYSSAGSSYLYGASISIPISVTGCNNKTINYYNANRVDVSAGGWLELGSVTFDVPHNSDGSKTIDISASFSNNVSPSSGSASGNMTLTKIPRQANVVSVPDFNDEDNPSISYSNSAGNSVTSLQACISLTGATDDIAYRDIPKTGDTYIFELTEEERNVLRSATITSNSRKVYFYVRTIIGGVTYYSYLPSNFTIINAIPIFSTYSYEDINDETLELTGNKLSIIKKYSTLKATVLAEDKAVAQKLATMSYYQIDNIKENYSDTDDVVLLVNNYDKNTIILQAVDSRSNSNPIEQTIAEFIEYEDLTKGSITLSRSNNGVGEFVTLKFNGTFWNGNFGQVDNELLVTYKYKKTTSQEYVIGTTSIVPTINENSFSFNNLIAGDTEENGFDINDSYDIEVEVSDKLSSVIFSGVIGTGIPAIAIYKNKVSLGDKYDTSLGGIQLWGDIYVNGNKIS